MSLLLPYSGEVIDIDSYDARKVRSVLLRSNGWLFHFQPRHQSLEYGLFPRGLFLTQNCQDYPGFQFSGLRIAGGSLCFHFSVGPANDLFPTDFETHKLCIISLLPTCVYSNSLYYSNINFSCCKYTYTRIRTHIHMCVCKLCLINNGISSSVFRGWASQTSSRVLWKSEVYFRV